METSNPCAEIVLGPPRLCNLEHRGVIRLLYWMAKRKLKYMKPDAVEKLYAEQRLRLLALWNGT
jgi:hypothetical protein